MPTQMLPNNGHGEFMILNGALVPFADARIHCLAPAVTYAANVFEGLRAYWNERQEQLYVFRLDDHLRRLDYSMKVMRFQSAYEPATLRAAVLRLLQANNVREGVHMRVHAYVDVDGMMTATSPIGMFVSMVARPISPQAKQGIHAAVSSWTRISDNSTSPRVKSTANYVNGRLASLQAKIDGYDNAILLTGGGQVAEGPGACLFIVREGSLVTPDVTQDILESITRATIIQGAEEWLNLRVTERRVARTELYGADEMFFCGTGQEIVPVVSVDRHPVGTGNVGPLTATLQQRYFALVRGETEEHKDWLTPVYE